MRAVIAENLVLKQQLIVLRRGRQRAPNLTLNDRLLCGFGSLFLSPGTHPKARHRFTPFHALRVSCRLGVASTVCSLRVLAPRSPAQKARAELKSRNPRFGCPRIAPIVSHTFGVDSGVSRAGQKLSPGFRWQRALLVVVH